MSTSRSKARAIAQAAIRVMNEGHYTNILGETISIEESLRLAVQRTTSYPPEAAISVIPAIEQATTLEVSAETTLACAWRLFAGGHRVVALNYASAKNPGGGFLGGAVAQEESLCRSSGLFACLTGNPMYDRHRAQGGGFYSNYAIYSPDVPVFFTDAGLPLPKPFSCSFITAPAVNAGVFLEQRPGEREVVRTEMKARIEKVLSIAASHGHSTIVLGAWGCGVFRNDPVMIAELFRGALFGPFAGRFAHVSFAVYDSSQNGSIRRAFDERFRG